MTEELKNKLKSQLPENFTIDDAMDYPETGTCRVRGYIGQWAILLEWYHRDSPEEAFLQAIGIDSKSQSGHLPFDAIKQTLMTLS